MTNNPTTGIVNPNAKLEDNFTVKNGWSKKIGVLPWKKHEVKGKKIRLA